MNLIVFFHLKLSFPNVLLVVSTITSTDEESELLHHLQKANLLSTVLLEQNSSTKYCLPLNFHFLNNQHHYLSFWFGDRSCWRIRNGEFWRFLHRVKLVDGWCLVHIGWIRLSGTLGFGPSSCLVLDVLGRQCTMKKLTRNQILVTNSNITHDKRHGQWQPQQQPPTQTTERTQFRSYLWLCFWTS